jgi:hypothetical protein
VCVSSVFLPSLEEADFDADVIRFPTASYLGEVTGGKYFTRAVDVFDT